MSKLNACDKEMALMLALLVEKYGMREVRRAFGVWTSLPTWVALERTLENVASQQKADREANPRTRKP